MKTFSTVLTAAALSALLLNAPASAEAPRANAVAGEKLDSGLGELPAYPNVLGQKLDSGLGELPPYPQVAGQKVDSGLGELPHYRLWTDKTGHAPLEARQVAKAETKR